MSFINSPTYNLSKFLSRILSSPLVNCYSVRNCTEFVDYVQNFTTSENEILVLIDAELSMGRLDRVRTRYGPENASPKMNRSDDDSLPQVYRRLITS